jgi:hypothetical protein
MNLPISLIRLAYLKPELREHLIPLIASSVLVAPTFLEKLVDYASKHEDSDSYSPMAVHRLRSLIRSVENGNIDPFPVSDLWEYLAARDVDPLEIALLKRVPLPRPARKPTRQAFLEAMRDFEAVAGKHVAYNIWLDDPDVDRWSLCVSNWTKAIKGLSKYPVAKHLYDSETKKIIVSDKPHGTESAAWRPGGVLFLPLNDPITAYVGVLIHELGHALEEKLNLNVTAWDDTPYGNPPFVSEYAKTNAAEDFAETFTTMLMERSLLKRIAPGKYADMKGRV